MELKQTGKISAAALFIMRKAQASRLIQDHEDFIVMVAMKAEAL